MFKVCVRCGKIVPMDHKCNQSRTYKKSKIDKLRSTYKWTQKSMEIRDKSNHLCAVCKDRNIISFGDTQVHHIEKLNDRPDLMFDNYNLITLCRYHHKLADNGRIDKGYLKKLAKKRENT